MIVLQKNFHRFNENILGDSGMIYKSSFQLNAGLKYFQSIAYLEKLK